MNQPEQQQIEHWFTVSNKWIPHWRQEIAAGEADQDTYTSLALDYASFARTKFLNGDDINEVRVEFTHAARCILKSFTMAYDGADPDYQGEKADLSCNSETTAIRGINYALMAVDFSLARELAQIYQTRPDGYMLGTNINRYVHVLKQWLLGEPEKALSLIQEQFEEYKRIPPKSAGDKNYYTLFTTLFGIVSEDNGVFNDGLQQQLMLYQNYARGEAKNTDEEFICDYAVALANLGIHHGLTVTITHDTLPPGLLLTAD